VFTRVFAEQVRKPGVNLVDLGETLREEVAKLARSVNHPQVPAVYSQILGARSVFLAGPAKEEPKPVLAPPPAAGPQADEIAWSFIEGTSDPKQLSAFLERFPRSALRLSSRDQTITLILIGTRLERAWHHALNACRSCALAGDCRRRRCLSLVHQG
jgi:uncharacterized protein